MDGWTDGFRNQILTGVSYRITDAVMVSSSADSGASVTTPDTVVLRWSGNDVDDTATSALYYAVSTTTYTSAADVETNATSFATGQAEYDNSYTSWDYYSASSLVPAGTYYIWAVMTDDSGDKTYKRSGGTVTFTHSAKIRVDTPPIGQTSSYSTKYATVEWTDVDYDQSAAVDLYYSTTDVVTGGTGGPVSSTGNLATIVGWGNSARINYDTAGAAEIAIAENTDNSGDRYLVDLGNEFSDGQTYYVYAVIDSDDDGTAEYGYQSGPVVITHGSRITMTAPAADDAASSNYTLTWQQEWEGYDATNVPVDVDLYYASVNTNVLSNLDNFSPSTTQGIIERDISVDTDADGDVDATGTAYWDDIVITSTTGATGAGTTLTVVDTNVSSYATNYLKGRRLVITGGSLEGETKTINGNVGSTITVDSAFSAATSTTGVESYKIYIPDGTYYVYGVLDTNAHADVQDRYNASDLDLSTDATDDSITIAATGGAADGTTVTFAYSATYHSNSDNYYNGARVTFTSGALVGESRTISDYSEAAGTSTITVATAFSAQVAGGNFRIDRPEVTSVSVGTVTINNYSVHTDMPEEFHSVGDAFNMTLTIDTGGQAITATNIYLDFNTTTLELVDASAPFCIVTQDTTDAAGNSTGTTVNGNAANVSSTIDYYNGDTIIITSGAARGESRTISDYDGAGLFTVSTAFSAQIASGTTYEINRALSNATNHNSVSSWTGLTVVENAGDNTAGTVNLVMVSGVSDAAAFTTDTSFISLGLKAKAAGNTEVTYAFDTANNRMTQMVDENGALHTPHNAGSAHVLTEGTATASISGKVALQGRTNHSALVTFELRQPGSLGHYTTYAPTADEDTSTTGVQITTGTDGSFTLADVPAGEWYLTAKAAHYLRGQNDDSAVITIRPGQDVVNVIINGYSDANADGDFADSGEEFGYLLAGEAFAGTSTSYEDNQINATDLAAFATYYGQTTAAALAAADINGDGAVNITDFGHIAANWGVSAINPTGAAGVSNAAPSIGAASVALYGVPDVLQVGKSYDVTLVARNASDLKGFSLDIGYDSNKATISDTRGAKAFGQSGKALFVSKDVKKGVSLGSALLADSTDTGALVQFTLEPTASGELVLELAQGQLVGRLGTEDILKNRFTLRVIANEPVTESYLAQNFPNPFNPETWIPYALKEGGQVQIRVFDSAGHLVRTLDQGFRPSAHYTQRGDAAYWDGRNRTGERVASGVYFYQIQAGDFQSMRRMVILK